MISAAYEAESLPTVIFLPYLMAHQDWYCLGFAAVRRVTMNAGQNTGKTLYYRAAFNLVVRVRLRRGRALGFKLNLACLSSGRQRPASQFHDVRLIADVTRP
jgi:hypothetical protein